MSPPSSPDGDVAGGRRRRDVTIFDVARSAGVSKSTVSRALNDSPLIGEETKQSWPDIGLQFDSSIRAARFPAATRSANCTMRRSRRAVVRRTSSPVL